MQQIPQPEFTSPDVDRLRQLPDQTLISFIRMHGKWHGKISSRTDDSTPYVEVGLDHDELDVLMRLLITRWYEKQQRRNNGSQVSR